MSDLTIKIGAELGDTLSKVDQLKAKLGQTKENVGLIKDELKGLSQSLAANDKQIAAVNKELKGLNTNTRDGQKEASALKVKLDQLANTNSTLVQGIRTTKTELAAESEAMKTLAKDVKAAESGGSGFTKGLSSVWGALRKIAYIVPGLGIAGLVGLLSGPLIDALKNVFESFNKTSSALKNTNDALEAGQSDYVKATLQVSNLRIAFDQAREGIITKKEALKLYNETIGKTTGEVKNLDEAEAALAKNADAYIKFTFLKAAANYALGESAKKAFEAEIVSRKKLQEFKNSALEARVNAGGIGLGGGSFNASEEERLRKLDAQAREKRKQDAVNIEKNKSSELLNIANDFFKQAEDIANKFKFDFNGIKGGDVVKTRKSAETILDILLNLRREINKIQAEEDFFGIDKSKEKISALQSAIDTLVKKFKVDPKDTLIQKLFGEIKDLQPLMDHLFPKGGFKLKTSLQVKLDAEQAQKELDKEIPKIKFEPLHIPLDTAVPDQFRKFYEELQKMNQQAADNIKQTLNGAFSSIGESIADSISKGADLGKTIFGNLFKVLGAGLQQLGEAMIAIGTAKIALEKFQFAPGIGTVIAGIAAVAIGALLKNAIPGFADGVTNFGGGVALVGERGPELIRLPKGSDVIPNGRLNGMSSGGSQVFIPDIKIRGNDLVLVFNRAQATINQNG